MTRGPAPKPTALKKLAGNPGKRPLNGAEPVYEPELPSCPRHLSPAARREWKRAGALLVGAGVMTAADRAVLAAYCQAWARWAEAEAELERGGLTDLTPKNLVVQSVYLQIANKAMLLMHKFAAELGLSPASRTRIHVERVEAKKSLAEQLFEGVADGRGD